MKAPLFEFPSYQYEVSDWEFKKKGLLNRINKSDLKRTPLQNFETDRQTDTNKTWVHYLQDFLKDHNFKILRVIDKLMLINLGYIIFKIY